MNLYVEEIHTNESENYLLDEPSEYETFTDSRGDLFRAYLKDGWGCKSKVYLETAEDPARAIGWYFEKNAKYEDTREIYKAGLWVTVLLQPTEKECTYTRHYA